MRPGHRLDGHAANSRKLMLLNHRGFPTLSAVYQTIDSESRLFVGLLVEWLDEHLDVMPALDAGCWNALSAA